MKVSKKISIVVITIILAIAINSLSFATTGEVNTDSLNFRREPSTDSEVLEMLNKGDEVEVIEKTGNWYKIKKSGLTGYVHADYLDIEDEEEITNNNDDETPSENKTPEPSDEESITQTNEDNILGEQKVYKDSYIYILPLLNSSKLSKINKDSKVTVISVANNWIYIQADNENGWILKSNIVIENTNNSSQEQGSIDNEQTENKTNTDTLYDEEKVMYVNTSSIYVRKGPSTDYEIIDSLVLNASVYAIGENGDWYKVKVNGKDGYIAKRLLSNSSQESTSRGNIEREESSFEETQVSTSTDSIPTTSKGEEIVNFAKKYLGCKYVYGGSGPSTFDCSGFTMYVYKNFGISLSHSATAQSKKGTYVAKSDLQPGDLVFFKDYETMDGIGHCGIYIGDGNFIHASSGTGYCVKISTLLTGSYNTRYETARRLI